MGSGCACLLLCLLLGLAPEGHAQPVAGQQEEQQPIPVVVLAAELAQIASKLAMSGSKRQGLGHRHHRKQQPAIAAPHNEEAAVQNINKGLVQSVPVEFKGHNLTVVALSNDEFVGKHILASKTPFQADLLGKLMDAVTPGSVVVDAGANMGDFTVFLAAATGPSGAVYAFEPQARMFQLLCTNMIINGLLNIVPMRNALSYEPGVLHMSEKVTDGQAGGLNYKDADKSEKVNINYGGMRLGLGGESVQAITLDSLNITNLSVMKVDIQGAEKPMFYGAQETIKRNLPVVAYEAIEVAMSASIEAELNLPQHVKDFNIENFLQSLGYSMQNTGSDSIATPPGKGGRRRLVTWLPPGRR